MIETTLDRTADLSDADRAAVRTLGRAVYPPGELDDWPGLALEWATPEWCVRVTDGGALVSYAGLYLRDATHDGRAVRVGGLGNVKTHPAARGRGHAGAAARRAAAVFAEWGVAFGLLVCEPELLAYYARFGWEPFAGRLVVRQRGTAAAFTLCPAMTLGVGAAAPAAGIIDLCGPPW